MSGGSALISIVFLAAVVEFLSERVFGKWLKGYYMVAIASALGIGACFAFNLDVVGGLMDAQTTIWGKVVSGILLGGGSGLVHDFINKFGLRKT